MQIGHFFTPVDRLLLISAIVSGVLVIIIISSTYTATTITSLISPVLMKTLWICCALHKLDELHMLPECFVPAPRGLLQAIEGFI